MSNIFDNTNLLRNTLENVKNMKIAVDQEYNPESLNSQSGTAVAGAITKYDTEVADIKFAKLNSANTFLGNITTKTDGGTYKSIIGSSTIQFVDGENKPMMVLNPMSLTINPPYGGVSLSLSPTEIRQTIVEDGNKYTFNNLLFPSTITGGSQTQTLSTQEWVLNQKYVGQDENNMLRLQMINTENGASSGILLEGSNGYIRMDSSGTGTMYYKDGISYYLDWQEGDMGAPPSLRLNFPRERKEGVGYRTETLATREWVSGVVSGKVDYLGIFNSEADLISSKAMSATTGDYARCGTAFQIGKVTAAGMEYEQVHVGDLIVKHGEGNSNSASNWDIIHTEDPGNYVSFEENNTLNGYNTFNGGVEFNCDYSFIDSDAGIRNGFTVNVDYSGEKMEFQVNPGGVTIGDLKNFQGTLNINPRNSSQQISYYTLSGSYYNYSLPEKSGTLATLADIDNIKLNIESGLGSGSIKQTGYTLDGVHEDFRHYAAAYGMAPSLGMDIETVMSAYTYEQLLGMIAQASFGSNTTHAEQYLYGMIDQVLADQDLEFLPNEVNGSASTAVGVGNKVWAPAAFVSGYKNIVGRKGNPLGAIGSAAFGKDLINTGSYSFVSGESLINNGNYSFVGGRKSSIKISGFEDPVDKENCSKMFDALVSQNLLTSYDENTEWAWDGNHSDSDRNFVFNGYISKDASKLNTVFGSSITTGYGTTTFGDQNLNSGQYNFIHGLSNFVISDPGDMLDVPESKSLGYHNFIYGARNAIVAKGGCATLFNHIVGETNELRNANYSSISGDWNTVGKELGQYQGDIHVQGHRNNVNGMSISLLGSDNKVKITDGKGLLLNGDSNTVGETIHYSTVIGDNNLVRNEKYATAIGCHLKLVEGKDYTQHRTALGKYNVDNKDAIFMIGNGTSESDRKNVFEVLKDGVVQIKHTPSESDDYAVPNINFVKTYTSSYTYDAIANHVSFYHTNEVMSDDELDEIFNVGGFLNE